MSGNLIILRRRIRTVKNTQKLTKAMKTVSAAKLRRGSAELNKARPYLRKIEELLREVIPYLDGAAHPLLQQKSAGQVILVVVSADKGLCGAFNSHVIKSGQERFQQLLDQGQSVELVTVGTKASRFFAKNNYPIKKSFPSMMSRLTYADTLPLAEFLQDIFASGSVKAVEFVFTEFVSASRQQLRRQPVLPLLSDVGPADDKTTGAIFEPDAASIFKALLPRYIQGQVYRMLLESVASEQAARMVAMDLATRNASDMIRSLVLVLNKLRQASITKELLEIMTATEALQQ